MSRTTSTPLSRVLACTRGLTKAVRALRSIISNAWRHLIEERMRIERASGTV